MWFGLLELGGSWLTENSSSGLLWVTDTPLIKAVFSRPCGSPHPQEAERQKEQGLSCCCVPVSFWLNSNALPLGPFSQFMFSSFFFFSLGSFDYNGKSLFQRAFPAVIVNGLQISEKNSALKQNFSLGVCFSKQSAAICLIWYILWTPERWTPQARVQVVSGIITLQKSWELCFNDAETLDK